MDRATAVTPPSRGEASKLRGPSAPDPQLHFGSPPPMWSGGLLIGTPLRIGPQRLETWGPPRLGPSGDDGPSVTVAPLGGAVSEMTVFSAATPLLGKGRQYSGLTPGMPVMDILRSPAPK